jgi:hypothetical protein
MKSFIKEFLNEDFEGVPGAPSIYVAAFGKHPAWNDHMDDVGLVTASLVELKQSLYVQGVSSQIQSRAWERLDPEKALVGFDHIFIWHRPNETVVGLIWSSRDGKGRQLYPMVLCAHVIAQSLDWVWVEVVPRLEAAAEACRKAASEKEVIVALNTIQEALRRRSVDRPPAESGPSARDSRLGIEEWTGHFARDPVALRRVCHYLSTNVSGLATAQDGDVRSRGVRLPAIPGATMVKSLNAWLLFLNGQIDPFWPVLLFMPRVGTWVDGILGEPTKEDFYRLRVAPTAQPIISTIPFSIGGDFDQRLEQLFSDVSSGRIPQASFLSGKSVAETLGTARQRLRSVRRTTAKDFFNRLLNRD